MGKVLIISAPSGSGKTTVVNHLLESFDCFAFSVSATTRAPRGVEKDGEAYYFISEEEFRRRIAADAFIEYEEVYKGVLYGTLKSEVDRIWKQGKVILFDVDEVVPDALAVIDCPDGLLFFDDRLLCQLRNGFAFRIQYDGVEDTVLFADRHLAVGSVGVEIDGVAGA